MKIMKLLVCIATLITVSQTLAQGNGAIAGKITDKELNNDPLPFANIFIEGTNKGAMTDDNGLYQITDIAAGVYTVIISFIGYETLKIPNVHIASGKVTEVNTALGAGNVSLDEVVVTTVAKKDSEIALLLAQKKAVEMKQSIAATTLATKGISDAESGVTKQSGVTKVASRGIFVRGLDDRYNALLINQLPASVVDWEQKIIPLDLFSLAMVRNIDINKVFYPQLYGDFAGATININTKDIPNKQVITLSFTTGFNDYALNKTFLLDTESESEYFGIGGVDARAIPEAFGKNTITTNVSLNPEESSDLHTSDFNFNEIDHPVHYGFGIVVGDQFAVKETSRWGYYIGMNYGNGYEFSLGAEQQYGVGGDFVRNNTQNNTFEYKTHSNVLVSLLYQNTRTSLKFNYLHPRSTSAVFSDTRGRNRDVDDRYARESRYKSSILHQFQGIGETGLNEENTIVLRYLATYGIGKFNQPDQKLWSYENRPDDGLDQFTTEFSNGQDLFFNRYFLSSDNTNIGGKLEVSGKFNERDFGYTHRIKAGLDANVEEIDFFNRFLLIERFQNNDVFIVDPDRPNAVIEKGFTDGVLRYAESTTPKSFVINNNTYAGYFNYNNTSSERFNFSAGLRVEYIDRLYTLQNIGILDQFISKNIERGFKFLPSLNAKYSLDQRSNLRFAASKSYTRPKNVEIAPFLRINSIGDSQLGNQDIKLSDNYSVDLKYEVFPNTGEVLSANTFAKYIDNPIETTLIPIGGTSFQTQFVNSDKAFLYGVEFEVIKNIGKLFHTDALNPISIGFNLTLMRSKVTIDRTDPLQAILTNDSRSLQGASDFLFNGDIAYRFSLSNTWKSTLTGTFSTFSPRISQVSTGGLDDRFEQPFNTIGVVWRNQVNGKVSFSIKVINLLNDVAEQRIDVNPTTQSYIRNTIGRNYTFSIDYNF